MISKSDRKHRPYWITGDLYPYNGLCLVDKNLLFGKRYRKNWPCVSSQIQPHDVVGATDWLKLRAEAMKGADADTVTGGLDLAIRAENRGHLGRPIPLTHLFV